MVYFQTQNPSFGKFWMALEWKMLAYFITIWNIFRPFGMVCGHLVYFSVLVCLHQEKSGNPAVEQNDCFT
jgi:hypothetical protein